MNKVQYLAELRKRLSLLKDTEVDRIAQEYEMYFNDKLTEGLTEDKILESLGDVNQVAKMILEVYHINEKYIKWFVGKEKFVDEINGFANKVADTSQDVLSKVESSVKTAFHKSKSFGEESFKKVKGIFKRKKTDETEQETI